VQCGPQRRLLLGVGLTAVAAALALVPLDVLSPPPAKPLFFFLTPLVRIQAQLDEAYSLVQDAQWDGAPPHPIRVCECVGIAAA